MDQETSHKLINKITLGDLIWKPGGIRRPIPATTTSGEIEFVCSRKELADNQAIWSLDYDYNTITNEFMNKNAQPLEDELVKGWFSI